MNDEKTMTNIHPLSGAVPRRAMILAAGLGKRMRPITDAIPKPLVHVHGRPLIDYGLDALERAGMEKIVVNVHYLPEQVEAHLTARGNSGIVVSDERDQLLDSGGGVAKALPELGGDPFYVLNADSFWIEGYRPNLGHMSRVWNDDRMDVLVLLAGMANSIGYSGAGDFTMDPEGRLARRGERHVAPFAYAGVAIMHPRLFTDLPEGPFSLNLLFDRAIENERMYGIRLDGLWLHVGTPEGIHEAEEAIARSAA